MSTLLELVGQLSNIPTRSKTSQKIAKALGAETLLIFIKDDELNILLPAPGYVQTINGLRSWQSFLAKCIKNKVHSGKLYFPDESTQTTATATGYKDELVFLLLGGRPDKQKMHEIRSLLPLLASLLKHEQRRSEAEVRLKIVEKSLVLNNEVIEKLYATRQELQLSIVHAQKETEARKISEQELASEQERLRFMAESMPQIVFTATPTGEIDYFNPQWSEYTGLNFKQISKWGWTQFIHPDDLESTIDSWKKALSNGKPFQFENRLRRHDGIYRLHLSRARAHKDSKGKIIMWIGSSTDIEDITQTAVRKDELELITSRLKQQRKQLMELNNAKDEFIALASHQLRTPATAVKQYISLVLTGYTSPVTSTQKQFLQTAFDSNERQLDIINDLLKTAQIDSSKYSLKKEHHVISNLLQDTISELEPTLKLKHQKLILEGANVIDTVVMDRNEMKLALSNLLENASKYSHPGSTVTVKLQKKNQKLMIEIQDSGVGISKDEINRIFEKFTRINNGLSDTVTGTGLGLYWVKQIIKLHGGTVKVNSKLGKGSTFIVGLPL